MDTVFVQLTDIMQTATRDCLVQPITAREHIYDTTCTTLLYSGVIVHKSGLSNTHKLWTCGTILGFILIVPRYMCRLAQNWFTQGADCQSRSAELLLGGQTLQNCLSCSAAAQELILRV